MVHLDHLVYQAAEAQRVPRDCRVFQVRLVTLETQVQWDLQDLPAHQEGREIQDQLDNQVHVVTPALLVQKGFRALQVSLDHRLPHTVF